MTMEALLIKECGNSSFNVVAGHGQEGTQNTEPKKNYH